jgi:hypothetical protein
VAYTEKTWKEKTMEERKKNEELIKTIREMKRTILEKMKELEEEIKNIMYVGE